MRQIPLKYVVDDHQRKNAAVLAEAGACRVVNDDNSTSQQLAIDELLSMCIPKLVVLCMVMHVRPTYHIMQMMGFCSLTILVSCTFA